MTFTTDGWLCGVFVCVCLQARERGGMGKDGGAGVGRSSSGAALLEVQVRVGGGERVGGDGEVGGSHESCCSGGCSRAWCISCDVSPHVVLVLYAST